MRRWQWVLSAVLLAVAVVSIVTAYQSWRTEHPAAAAPPAVTASAPPSAVSLPQPAETASPTPTPSAATKPSVSVPVSTPIWVGISSIGVAANVTPVQLGKDGSLEPPPSPLVGWWSQRGRPGGTDTTYLVGHTISGKYGIFGQLGKIPVGAKIVLVARDAHGRTHRLTYTVTRKVSHPQGWQGKDVWGVYPRTLILSDCTGYQGSGKYTSNWYIVAELDA